MDYVHLKTDVGFGSLKRKRRTNHADLVVQQKDHLAIEIEESLREWKPYLWKFFVVGLELKMKGRNLSPKVRTLLLTVIGLLVGDVQ